MDTAFQIERLCRLYYKAGGISSLFVKSFNAWPAGVCLQVMEATQLRDDDIPFLLFYENSYKWTLLTIKQIIWTQNGEMNQVQIDDLKDVTLLVSKVRKNGIYNKSSVKSLSLIRRDETIVDLPFEPGSGSVGLWNVLKMMISQSPASK
jgi:hypothetical protein